MRSRLAVLVALSFACTRKTASVGDAGAPFDAGSASAPAPSATVRSPPRNAIADGPDVRVTLPNERTATVRAGQTFGILVPHPADFLDEWALEEPCPLGAPLTFVSRGDPGRELLWNVGADKIGTHVVIVQRMHAATRTAPKKPVERVQVTVVVTRA